MSEVFSGYERRYCELSGNASRQVAALSALSGEPKQQRLDEFNTMLSEADSLIRFMDLEARSLPAGQKASLLAKLREYKADLQALRRSATLAATAATAAASGGAGGRLSAGEEIGEENARKQLLGSSSGAAGEASFAQRAKLLGSTAVLEESSSRLESSRRALLETEELGVSILEDLHAQRQTLLHTRDTLFGVDDSINRGRQILTSMARRMNRNKLISIFIIVVLLLAIILVIYFKTHSQK